MTNFNWTREDIMNSNLSEEYKEMLLAELEGKLTTFDPTNTRANLQSHLELGRNFREAMKDLRELDPKMVDVSLNECLNYAPDEEVLINIHLPYLTPEILVGEILYAFDSLNDKAISEAAHILTDPKNGHLRITEASDANQLCDEVRGRCIKNPYQNVVFASYYMRKRLTDFTTLSHEIGHMLSMNLFGTNLNPIVRNYLTELEAYYFEFLCANYLDKVTTDPRLIHASINDRLVKSIDYMWCIRKQYILSKYLVKPSVKRLNKDLARISNADRVSEDNYFELYRFPTSYINDMTHSVLAAADLAKQTIEDPEKGIALFKMFMTSDKTNLRDLYRDANITYLDDECSSFRKLHEDAKPLKKLIK